MHSGMYTIDFDIFLSTYFNVRLDFNFVSFKYSAQKIRSANLTKNAIKTNLPKEYYIRKLTDITNENERLQKRIKTMETQAQANHALLPPPPMNNNTAGVDVDALIEDMSHWEDQITHVYDAMKTAQENYFSQYR